MKPSHVTFASIATVLTAVIIYAFSWRFPNAAGAQVELTIATSGNEFVLADATKVHWDRVYVFRPYDEAKFIDESLGFPWPHSEEAGLENSEGYSVIVFVNNKHVAAWAKVPRNEFEFDVGKPGSAVARGDAVFEIERRPGQSTMLRRRGLPAENR